MAWKQYEYDFNIIHHRTYDSKDAVSQFVKFIANTLEKDGKTGFYPERDFLPGKNLFDENIRLMDVSRSVILVVDEAFLKDGWSKYLKNLTLKTKLDKDIGESVIPVSFCVGYREIDKRCKPLKCHEFVYFGNDYRDDTENLDKLSKVVKLGAPIPDEKIEAEMRRTVKPVQETEPVNPSKVVSSGTSYTAPAKELPSGLVASQISGVSLFDRSQYPH